MPPDGRAHLLQEPRLDLAAGLVTARDDAAVGIEQHQHAQALALGSGELAVEVLQGVDDRRAIKLHEV
jgi:hypothetical protein